MLILNRATCRNGSLGKSLQESAMMQLTRDYSLRYQDVGRNDPYLHGKVIGGIEYVKDEYPNLLKTKLYLEGQVEGCANGYALSWRVTPSLASNKMFRYQLK